MASGSGSGGVGGRASGGARGSVGGRGSVGRRLLLQRPDLVRRVWVPILVRVLSHLCCTSDIQAGQALGRLLTTFFHVHPLSSSFIFVEIVLYL